MGKRVKYDENNNKISSIFPMDSSLFIKRYSSVDLERIFPISLTNSFDKEINFYLKENNSLENIRTKWILPTCSMSFPLEDFSINCVKITLRTTRIVCRGYLINH